MEQSEREGKGMMAAKILINLSREIYTASGFAGPARASESEPNIIL